MPVGGEEAAVQASSVFSQAQIRKKLLLVHPIPFFTFFLARLNKIIYYLGLQISKILYLRKVICKIYDNNLLFRCKKYKIKP